VAPSPLASWATMTPLSTSPCRGGQAGVAGRDDVGPSRWIGDDSALAFEQDGGAAPLRRGAGALEAAGRDLLGRKAEQAAQLAFVRRGTVGMARSAAGSGLSPSA